MPTLTKVLKRSSGEQQVGREGQPDQYVGRYDDPDTAMSARMYALLDVALGPKVAQRACEHEQRPEQDECYSHALRVWSQLRRRCLAGGGAQDQAEVRYDEAEPCRGKPKANPRQ